MTTKRYSRRSFLKSAGAGAGSLACASVVGGIPGGKEFINSFPYLRNPKISNKVVVLGMDGMDPDLLRHFIDKGAMPTFKKLLETASLSRLQTTLPPQSPVAWSSFISGTNPGGHGIYDFIHRDPATLMPRLSISKSYDAKRSLSLGKWKVPIDSGRVELMRKGPAFWSILEEKGIPASVFQVPSNFPVISHETKAVSGMGTPDLLGGYGSSSYYSDVEIPGSEHFDGTRVKKIRVIDHVVRSKIFGPANSLTNKGEETEIEFAVHRDPWEPVAKITIQDKVIVLKQGEWSEWVPLKFELMPLFATVGGMVRFYMKEVHPHFKLYVTPINIDPMEPAFPICSPASYSRELSQAVGRFYTQGLPADTKGLSLGILSDDDYLMQANIVLEENMRSLRYQLSQFHEGFLFFYFSSIDQNCHMLMRSMDPHHPLYDPNASPAVKGAVQSFYTRMDDALRETLEKMDSRTTLMVLSDHGFGGFRREFHLNTWLVEQGYTVLTQPLGEDEGDVYSLVDWSKTRAYGLGFNGLYINMKDREPHGIVSVDDAQALKDEIIFRLMHVTDQANGAPVISKAYDAAKSYSGPFVGLAPDILVGYQRGYRVSDQSVLGKFPNQIIGDRTSKWSADHCFDPQLIPGILLSNRKCVASAPGIWDMAPSILAAFGIETPSEMDGKNIFDFS